VVELDYLVIGHATRDLRGGSFSVGGTATYAARTAEALGCRVGVITSTDADLDLDQALPDALIVRYPAPTTTTFENIVTDGKRQQVIHHVAQALVPSMAPDDWRADIVHIGPVAQECHPTLMSAFGRAFVGVTPQGWMRQWDRTGKVRPCRWEESEHVLPRADAVVLSLEDLSGNWGLAAEYAGQTRLLALTQGAEGCTIYADGETRHFPGLDVEEEDSTGAGDVFAASFFCALHRGRDPWTAARFANCVAAQSVTRAGLSGTPSAQEAARCRQAALGAYSAKPLEDGKGNAHHLRAG
jgi:sugar/nucleoside kinase (ribokinase family)